METFLFEDLLTLLGFSIAVLLLGHRLHIPPVVGFLFTGMIAGPHGLGLIHDQTQIERLAEIGMILLLFGIGMEFSLRKFLLMKRLFLLGGALQVGLTILVITLITRLFGYPWAEGLFWGGLIAMSSTAIVFGLLNQKGEMSSPHGRIMASLLIFQDMMAIPMLLLTPLLGHPSHFQIEPLFLWSIFKGSLILILVFISAHFFIPHLLLWVARTRHKDLFLLSVLMLCFGVAWITSSLGLSLTIGAFLAGLILSESEYSHEAINHLFPFQALFISFFFVSVGMLLNIGVVLHQPMSILLFAVAILGIKVCTGALTTLILGFPIRTALLVGIGLSQIGEFSFLLAQTGLVYGLGSQEKYQIFLAASLLTLIFSPLFIHFAPQMAWVATFLPLPQRLKTGFYPQPEEEKASLKNHVIIVGFGVSGRHLARSCKLASIPYVVLEMNPDTVKEQKKKGEPIHFGDATHLSVLERVGLKEAKALALLINDPLAARRIAKIAHEAHPSLYLIARTRYLQEISLMKALGADEVIPDEFGTSIEVFSRVLLQYHVPQEDIQTFISEIRADGYELLRHQGGASPKLSEIKLHLSGVEIGSFRLHSESMLVGKSLSESQLRQRYAITVIFIKRGGKILINPLPEAKLIIDDVLVVVGEKIAFKQVEELFGCTKL